MNLVEAIKSIEPSVVRIFVTGNVPDTKSVESSTGSGFYANNSGHIVTNNHVIESYYYLENAKIYAEIVVSQIVGEERLFGSFLRVRCDVVIRDESNDLAVIKLQQNPFEGEITFATSGGNKVPKIPTFNVRRVEAGDRVAVSGYPLGEPNLVTTSGFIAASLSQNGTYHADMQVNPGNSGGPVYLVESGEVIGVAVSYLDAEIQPYAKSNHQPADLPVYLPYNSGISQVIGIRKLIELVEANGIPLG